MQTLLIERAMTGIVRKQQGNTSFHAGPADTYQTQDGWILISVLGNPMFRRWARLVERPDLIDDPRCADDLTRGDHFGLINEVMGAWCADRTTEACIGLLEEARIPCGPVYQVDQTLNDAQVKARELLQPVHYPGIGDVPLPANPVRLSRTPGGIRHRAPLIGEHTEAIMHELGYSDAEIVALQAENII